MFRKVLQSKNSDDPRVGRSCGNNADRRFLAVFLFLALHFVYTNTGIVIVDFLLPVIYTFVTSSLGIVQLENMKLIMSSRNISSTLCLKDTQKRPATKLFTDGQFSDPQGFLISKSGQLLRGNKQRSIIFVFRPVKDIGISRRRAAL